MNITLPQVEHLIRELGPQTPDISEIIQDDEHCWSLCWDDKLWLAMEFKPEPDRLLICTVLGSPDELRRPAIHAAMLGTNALFAAHGSLRIALNYPEEELLLLKEHAPPQWSVQALSSDISRFVAHANALIQEIQRDVYSSADLSSEHLTQQKFLPSLA